MEYTVDINGMASYADLGNDSCDCLYCRNYLMAFASTYPEVVELLRSLGVRAEQPIEVMDLYWNTAEDKRLYFSYYSVKGEFFSDKTVIYSKGSVAVTLYQPDTDAHIFGNTRMELPYFIVEISGIELPWVMAEMPES